MRRLVTATLAAAVFALPASITLAQDKKAADKGAPKATMKVIAENPKVRAYEVTFAPGAENTSVPASSIRVVRALAGGTLERIYTDGKKEKVSYKTGEVRINEVSPAFTTKNIGKSEIKLYVVQVK
jgi:hypothetical protein